MTQVEGYPSLVVHGPLIATLLLDLLRRNQPGAQIARFEFRALRPTFDTAPFRVHGRPDTLLAPVLPVRESPNALPETFSTPASVAPLAVAPVPPETVFVARFTVTPEVMVAPNRSSSAPVKE